VYFVPFCGYIRFQCGISDSISLVKRDIYCNDRPNGILNTYAKIEVPFVYAFQKIIEKRIKDAQKRGEFDDLPGSGEPLTLEDDSQIPEDLRLAYKILKNADCLPPELELKKEIRKMEDMLEDIPDEKEKYRHMKRINYKIMQLNMMGKKSPLMEETEIYYSKLVKKLAQK
jgi:hypothetical protein